MATSSSPASIGGAVSLAIAAFFPETVVHTYIGHLIQASLRYAPRRDYDAVVEDLRMIGTAIDANDAERALDAFEKKCGRMLPPAVRAGQQGVST